MLAPVLHLRVTATLLCNLELHNAICLQHDPWPVTDHPEMTILTPTGCQGFNDAAGQMELSGDGATVAVVPHPASQISVAAPGRDLGLVFQPRWKLLHPDGVDRALGTHVLSLRTST